MSWILHFEKYKSTVYIHYVLFSAIHTKFTQFHRISQDFTQTNKNKKIHQKNAYKNRLFPVFFSSFQFLSFFFFFSSSSSSSSFSSSLFLFLFCFYHCFNSLQFTSIRFNSLDIPFCSSIIRVYLASTSSIQLFFKFLLPSINSNQQSNHF